MSDVVLHGDAVEQLRGALLDLRVEDFDAALDGTQSEHLQEICDLLGIKVQARFVANLGRMLRPRVREAPAEAIRLLAIACLARPQDACVEALGDAREHPTREELAAAMDTVIARTGQRLARFLLVAACALEFDAADAARNLLETDERFHRPAEQATQTEPGEEVSLEGNQGLFSPLDVLLIRTAVASANETVGAPSPVEVARTIDEIVRLNADRRSSYFHVGFLEGLGLEPSPVPAAVWNDERRTWHLFGRLNGELRRDPALAATTLLDATGRVRDVVRDPEMGPAIGGDLIQAVLTDEPSLAASLLADLGGVAFAGWPRILPALHEKARHLLAEGKAGPAEDLWRALLTVPGGVLEQFAIDAERRLVSCARAAEDWPRAKSMVDELLDESAPEAILLVERGLVAAQAGHLRHLRIVFDPAGVEHLQARLERGEDDFRQAMQTGAGDWRAAYCLGLLARCRGAHEDTSALLSTATSELRRNPFPGSKVLATDAAFAVAVASLEALEPGRDGPAVSQLLEALSDGARPRVEELVRVLGLLTTYQSEHTCALLSRIVEMKRWNPTKFVGPAKDLACSGEVECVGLALTLARSVRVPPKERLELVTAAFEGAYQAGHMELLDDAFELGEDVAMASGTDECDEEWLTLLRTAAARDYVGSPWIDLMEIDVLARCGEREEAQGHIRSLFYRAVESMPYLDPEELLGRFTELGGTDAELDQLRAAVPTIDEPERVINLERDVEVIFVGGDERQREHDAYVEESLRDLLGNHVKVHWIHSGWGTNWKPHALEVERGLATADAVVLMQFVRTNLGRHIRRVAGEADVPWMACTGHSRNQMRDAIVKAVALGARKRSVASTN